MSFWASLAPGATPTARSKYLPRAPANFTAPDYTDKEPAEDGRIPSWRKIVRCGRYNHVQMASWVMVEGLMPEHIYQRDVMEGPGKGVRVYIMDTGINIHHGELTRPPGQPPRASHFGDRKDTDKSP
jgi:hypothetical protein